MPKRWSLQLPAGSLIDEDRVAGHTAPMIDDSRLPGGIGVVRAWWLVRRPRRVRVATIATVLLFGVLRRVLPGVPPSRRHACPGHRGCRPGRVHGDYPSGQGARCAGDP